MYFTCFQLINLGWFKMCHYLLLTGHLKCLAQISWFENLAQMNL